MKLLSVSGKKQSGKGTTYLFIKALNDLGGRPTREFSFAWMLKRMAVDVLGLQECQAFGTNAEKDTLVPHLLWEHFPVQECRRIYNDRGYVRAMRSGPMTGREVLQYWGSEVFRRQFSDVWADSAIRMVRAWLANSPDGVAVLTDCRFPNEVQSTLGAGGVVGRLTRNPHDDQHSSERALDRDVFDWGRFTFLWDNSDYDVYQALMLTYPDLVDAGLVPHVAYSKLRDIALSIEETSR